MPRSALLVVDLQNAFCHPEGSAVRAGVVLDGLDRALEVNVRAVEAAHEADVPVVFTRHVYRSGYADLGRNLAPLRPLIESSDGLLAGTWDGDVIDGLGRRPEDHVVDKARFDAFLCSPLEALLRAQQVEHLWVTGVITSVCVESTVRSGSMRDFAISLVPDGCADQDADTHERTVDVLTRWAFAAAVDVEDISRRRTVTA